MAPIISFEEGTYKGTKVRFKNLMIVGSGENANLKLQEEKIAPMHLAFIKGNDGFYIISLDANNYITLNGEVVQNGRLNNGDIIGIAENCILKFILENGDFAQSLPEQKNSTLQKKRIDKNKAMDQEKFEKENQLTEKKSKFSTVVSIVGWFIIVLFILLSSFVTGVYITEIILKA